MSSLLPGFEYDIFISYRHKDNKGGHWVTEFVEALKTELEATFKEDISIYFDENPHDGLLETHNVDKSLEGKLKCLIFIPIISQTYCDPKSFAWQRELCVFNKMTKEDQFGKDIKLRNGNVSSRILPLRIHELDTEDRTVLENELGGVLRAIEFIYKEAGVNRPLTAKDDEIRARGQILYRDQVNKVANAIKEIITGIKSTKTPLTNTPGLSLQAPAKSHKRILAFGSLAVILLALAGYFLYPRLLLSIAQEGNLYKSIAVLPFENMSGDVEQEYFSDGISEEILNSLAQIEGLKVTGRTSSFQFKGKEVDLKEVGEKLGVATILEGSIRKQNDQLRITVQLVNAKNGYRLWSQRFDRKVTDIFAVQDEIAQAVSSKLMLTLFRQNENGAETVNTANKEAYDLYLKGRFFYNKRGPGLSKGLELFKQAVALDSTFAQAYEGMASSYVQLAWYEMIPSLEGIRETKKWALKAIELEPSLAEAYAAFGYSTLMLERDWNKANQLIQKSLEKGPNNAFSQIVYSNYLLYVKGDPIQAEKEAKIVSQLDPFLMQPYNVIGQALMVRGEYEQAKETLQKSIDVNNSSSLPYTLMSQALLLLKKPNEAIAVLEKNMDVTGRMQAMLVALCEAHAEGGNNKEAMRVYNELLEMERTRYVAPYTLGRAAIAVGKLEEAFKYFDQALEQKNNGFLTWKYYPYGEHRFRSPFMKDPRYKKIMERLAFPEK